MTQLIVVESMKGFPLTVADAEVVTARKYLTDRRFVDMRRANVFNLCRDKGYQGLGYYVSLLAAARNHKPLPSLATIQNVRHSAVIQIASDDLDNLVQRSLSGIKSDEFVLSIYFGRNLASRYDRLCQALFDQFPAPLVRATFKRSETWKLSEVRFLSTQEIPESHREFLAESAKRYFQRPRIRSPESYRYDLAILVNPDEKDAPSNPRAIERFVRAARQVGIRAFVVGKEEYGRIAEYDALFIRETTSVNHRTFRFATRAEREGLVVIDDSESILRCCNKVYQAELFEKHSIPCPRTLVVHAGNRDTVGKTLGFPCVLKRPDSSFSQGVVKANNEEELKKYLDAFLNASKLVIAQAYVESTFDWRVGVLDGKALYVCRYFMARGHWQILKKGQSGKTSFGRHETLPVDEAPGPVIALGVKAANLIGRGLYGVDIKETDGRLVVMEVNDNPTIESGVEDAIIKDELYLSVMRVFYDRLESRGRFRI